MARKLDPNIRSELLEQSLAYCVKKGFSEFSLRALADEIGTSHRMLIYHFGSSEKLFKAVLDEFRLRMVANFEMEFNNVKTRDDFRAALKRLWRQLASEENRLTMISYLEIQVASIRAGDTRATSAYLEATLESWLEPIETATRRFSTDAAESRLLARLILGAGRGLILDNLASGGGKDSNEVRDAFSRLVDSLIT